MTLASLNSISFTPPSQQERACSRLTEFEFSHVVNISISISISKTTRAADDGMNWWILSSSDSFYPKRYRGRWKSSCQAWWREMTVLKCNHQHSCTRKRKTLVTIFQLRQYEYRSYKSIDIMYETWNERWRRILNGSEIIVWKRGYWLEGELQPYPNPKCWQRVQQLCIVHFTLLCGAWSLKSHKSSSWRRLSLNELSCSGTSSQSTLGRHR